MHLIDLNIGSQEDLVSTSWVLALLCFLAGPVKQSIGTRRGQANHLLARFLALGRSSFPEACQLHLQVWSPTSGEASCITVELCADCRIRDMSALFAVEGLRQLLEKELPQNSNIECPLVHHLATALLTIVEQQGSASTRYTNP